MDTKDKINILEKEIELLKLKNEGIIINKTKDIESQVNILVVYILWIFVGLIGLHHFYIAYKRGGYTYWISGSIMFFTLGGFGFWWMIDSVLNLVYIKEANQKINTKEVKPS